MSPILFQLYGGYLMKEALPEFWDFKIGRRIINKVRFADIMAKTQEELQDVVNSLVDTGMKYDIEINIEKPQVRRVSRSNELLKFKVINRELKEVDDFKYLGSVLIRDDNCTKEIKMRIIIAKEEFNWKISLLKSKLNIELRRKLVRC